MFDIFNFGHCDLRFGFFHLNENVSLMNKLAAFQASGKAEHRTFQRRILVPMNQSNELRIRQHRLNGPTG